MLNPASLFHNSIVHGNILLRHAYKTGSNSKASKLEVQQRRPAMLADTSFRQTTTVSAKIPARSAVILLLYFIRNCKTEQLVRQLLEITPALLITNQKT
jgi:hypothetical protein